MTHNAENDAPTIPAMALRLGDRFVVEPGEGDEFEATLTGHYGWGMVHGQIELAARRDDGEEFLYSVHYQAPTRVIPPADAGCAYYPSCSRQCNPTCVIPPAEVEHDEWCAANGCRCGKCPCLGPPSCVIPPASDA